MKHYEIEQVLRKQLSHMTTNDPLEGDFYFQMMNAKEGKLFQGFGVPGLNHVYISNKYSKNKDGSAILPPGTLGKTSYVSVHAPKALIDTKGTQIVTKLGENDENEDENELLSHVNNKALNSNQNGEQSDENGTQSLVYVMEMFVLF